MAGAFALFGTILLYGFLAPPAAVRAGRRLAWGSLALMLAAGIAWFFLQSAVMASAADLSALWAALPLVAGSTRFGHLLILRCFCAILAAIAFRSGYRRSALAPAGIAVIAEAWLDHGGAMAGPVGNLLLISTILHLAAGAGWIGSLPALFLSIRSLPPPQAAALARRFSPLGLACVLAMVATAAVQYWFLIAIPSALVTSDYGRVALAKILLLGGLICLAALNRRRLTPALFAGRPDSRAALCASIGAEIALGFLAVLAAGLLLNFAPPAMAAMLAAQQ